MISKKEYMQKILYNRRQKIKNEKSSFDKGNYGARHRSKSKASRIIEINEEILLIGEILKDLNTRK